MKSNFTYSYNNSKMAHNGRLIVPVGVSTSFLHSNTKSNEFNSASASSNTSNSFLDFSTPSTSSLSLSKKTKTKPKSILVDYGSAPYT